MYPVHRVQPLHTSFGSLKFLPPRRVVHQPQERPRDHRGAMAVELRFKEAPLKGQKFVLFACTLRDILEGRRRSCRLATLLVRSEDDAEGTTGEGQKR